MFVGFFYALRAHKFGVSLNEWMTLMEGLLFGLHHSSLSGFYELCRAVLVKSEADYDRFDGVFLEYFKDIPFTEDLPEELLEWLNHPQTALEEFRAFLREQGYEEKSIEEILKMFEERLKEQTEEHNGGSYWIGTGGYSNFGNSGHSPQGIRVGGQSRYRRAFEVAGERRYRDFRKDNTLDIRQFQMAFRLLRQYSDRTMGDKTEFDVDGTIRDTCDNAGTLKVRYKRPRRNTVKVLMLMDSGGSMDYYSGLCSMLFQAARQSNHFKELHIFYFHNCIYSSVYTDPRMYRDHAVSTEWLLKNFGSEYKVILVGDALMDNYELLGKRYDYRSGDAKRSGMDWIELFAEQYPHLIWLNPESPPYRGGYWGESYYKIAEAVDMHRLTVEGLEQGMKKLLSNR
ncbi:MAG: VWA domain-containing protein [Oscillospiraceae bacterium]|nr:VWA domain-containing protein [Oscillospiraceae bacterium]